MHSRTINKIRIVRIIARLIIGGPTAHVIGLGTGLEKDRFDQLLVYGSENKGEQSLADEAVSAGIRTLYVPDMVAELSIKPRDIRTLVKLYRIIKRERPDIIHTHTAKSGVWGRVAARLAGVNVIIHTYHGHILHGYHGPLKSRLLRLMEKLLGRITTKIVAVSQGVKDELVRFRIADPSKIIVIPLGLDLSPYLECVNLKGYFKKEQSIPAGAPLVGIVGRIVHIKNHRLFLEAAAMIASKMPDTRFVIVGDGPLRAQEEARARRLGIADKVLFTGWRRDLAAIYADMDALVVSSISEGTPVSAIEAMAAGCPVVATRVGGVPDLIADGETGLLANSGDARQLSEAVMLLIRDRVMHDRITLAARTAVVAKHSMRQLIDDIGRLYIETVSENAGHRCAE